MNLAEAKELLKADILTEDDLDALLAAERERCAKVAERFIAEKLNLSYDEIGKLADDSRSHFEGQG